MKVFGLSLVANWPFCHHGPKFLYFSTCPVFTLKCCEFLVFVIGESCCEVRCEGPYLLCEGHPNFKHFSPVVGDVVDGKGLVFHSDPYVGLGRREGGQLEAGWRSWRFVRHDERWWRQ